MEQAVGGGDSGRVPFRYRESSAYPGKIALHFQPAGFFEGGSWLLPYQVHRFSHCPLTGPKLNATFLGVGFHL